MLGEYVLRSYRSGGPANTEEADEQFAADCCALLKWARAAFPDVHVKLRAFRHNEMEQNGLDGELVTVWDSTRVHVCFAELKEE